MLGTGYVYPFVNLAQGGSGIGPELITNGDMGSATGWTLGANWTIAAGVATKAAGAANNLSQVGILTLGRTYRMFFSIVSISAGVITPAIGSGTSGPGFTTTGTFSFTGVCTGSTDAIIQGDLASAANIDNVSVRCIDKS